MQHTSHSHHRPDRGFTFLEILVVIGIIMIVSTFAFVALQSTVKKFKMQGISQEITQLMFLARAEAVRRSAPVAVVIDWNTYDTDPDGGPGMMVPLLAVPLDDLETTTIAGETANVYDFAVGHALVGNYANAGAAQVQVHLWGSADNEPWDCDSVDGFTQPSWRNNAWSCDNTQTPNIAVLQADGSIEDAGAFRVGMGPFPRSALGSVDDNIRNFLEIRCAPQATAKIKLHKWVPKIDPTDLAAGYYVKQRVNNKMNWVWY